MATTTIDEILRSRANALARVFHEAFVPPLVQARDLAHAVSLRSHGGGTVEPFRNAFIWRKPSADATSLWVRADDDGYRAAFRAFLETLYGADTVDFSQFEAFDVDHLFNRSNALGADYLRVEGIARGINRSHGGGFERRNTGAAISIAQRARKEQRLMTFVSVLKVAGLKAPRTVADTARMQPIYAFMQPNGWPKQEIDEAIAALLQKSRF